MHRGARQAYGLVIQWPGLGPCLGQLDRVLKVCNLSRGSLVHRETRQAGLYADGLVIWRAGWDATLRGN